MKKFIAVLLVLAVVSASVFAAPVSTEAGWNNDTVQAAQADTDLFADVQGVALTDEEAQAVEGEGPWGAFFGALFGATVGAIDWVVNGKGDYTTVMTPATTGAFIGWLFFPW